MSVYVIAEAGVNHNGDFDLAKELVRVSAECGADAVKFQTFKASKLVTNDAPKAAYQNENDKSSNSQKEMLEKLELTDEEFIALSQECDKYGIDFLTTCFDSESLNIICRETDPKYLKVGSGDLTNLPLIVEHARTARKIILSTGMATLSEVEDAIAALAFGYLSSADQPESYNWLKNNYFTPEALKEIRDKVTILHCVTDYPAKPEDLNLDAMRQLRSAYKFNVGYSDHSLGNEACCAAVALGATCIEKHITLDKSMDGPDHSASSSPDEFRGLVKALRNLEKALIPDIKAPTSRERSNIAVARKYLVVACDVAEGDFFTKDNLEIKRSGGGLNPSEYWNVLGKRAQRNYSKGDPIE